MTRENAIARREQFRVAGKIVTIKRPIGMVVELLVSLVESVGGCEERDGIGNVNGHRHIQLATGVPHGIKTRIINLDQGAGGDVLTQIKTERLQNLEPPRPVAVRRLDRRRLNL